MHRETTTLMQALPSSAQQKAAEEWPLEPHPQAATTVYPIPVKQTSGHSDFPGSRG